MQKQVEDAQDKFKNHELEDAKVREEMKNSNIKRKKLMHIHKTETEKYEALQARPKINK